MRESAIERYLVNFVKNKGGECRKVKWLGRRGAPDRVVMLPGKVIWVELKATGKFPSAHQRREINRMRAMGQTVYVIDSIEAIVDLIR